MDTILPAGVVPVGAEVTPATRHRVHFNARTDDYFRVWIVNLALTVVTLGVYWAWAKVRNRRYLYGHTWLDGHNFDYTADPVAILKGHLVFTVLLALFVLSQVFSPVLYVVLALAFALILPLLRYQALRFGAANTRHRGLRFRFHGTQRGAYAAYLGWPLLLGPALGLILPHVTWVQRRYLLDNVAYGTARAQFQGQPGPVWVVYLVAFALTSAVGVAGLMVAMVLGVGVALGGGEFDEDTLSSTMLIVLVPLYVLGLAATTFIGAYVQGALLRYSLENVVVPGELRLTSTVDPWRYAWIAFTNLLAQALTFGLATPWATIRRLSYVLPSITVLSTSGLAGFTAATAELEPALGEAATEFLGFDIGL